MFPILSSDFREHGVTLTIATDPDFDARAQAILAGQAEPVFALKPYLAVVANHNPRTVVAYTVLWHMTRRNQSTEVNTTQFKFPDAVAGTGGGLALLQGRELRQGDQRLVGIGFEVWPVDYIQSYRQFGLEAAAGIGEISRLAIALDAVIFDDGVLLGPDRSRLAEHFIAYVQAKQTIYRDVVVGLENGQLGEQVFAPLRERITTGPDCADPVEVYAHQSAVEAIGWRDRILLEVFRRALRREPFSIHRSES